MKGAWKSLATAGLLFLFSCGEEPKVPTSSSEGPCSRDVRKDLSRLLGLSEEKIRIVGTYPTALGTCRVVFVNLEDFTPEGVYLEKEYWGRITGYFGLLLVEGGRIYEQEKELKLYEEAGKIAEREKRDYWWGRIGEEFEKLYEVGEGDVFLFLVIEKREGEGYRKRIEKLADEYDVKIEVLAPREFEKLVGKFPFPFYQPFRYENGKLSTLHALNEYPEDGKVHPEEEKNYNASDDEVGNDEEEVFELRE